MQSPIKAGFVQLPNACVEYAYNQLGQRILDDRTLPNGNQLARFTYNQRLELVKSKRERNCQPPEIHTYAYDFNHNLVEKDGLNYSNNLADQLLTAGTANLSYNGAGQATDVANWDITYNCSDQITGIQAPGKNIAYRYDAGGQRVSKSVNGTTSHYLWDGGDIRKEYNANGSVKAEYFLGAGREGIKSGGQWYYYLSDIQGSTLMLTDAQGNPAATYDYTDYGETRQTSGSTALYNPFLYTGQEYDAETGLYHLRARHYSPDKGRFFARDPIGYAGGSNMYAYCAGDPIGHSDPSGLAGEGCGGFRTRLLRALAQRGITGAGGEAAAEWILAREFGKRLTVGALGGPAGEALAAGLAAEFAYSLYTALTETTVLDLIGTSTPRTTGPGTPSFYSRSGGFDAANADFDSLRLSNVRPLRGHPDGRMGDLPDGRIVNVRSSSSGGAPTLEVYDGRRRIKFRYD